MNTKIYTTLFLLLIAVLFISCSKEENQTPTSENKSLSELNIPADFTWETTLESKVIVSTKMSESIGQLVKIEIYDASPLDNGNLIATGSAGYDFPFETTLRFAASLSSIYIKATGAKGSSQIASVSVSNSISYTFDEPTGGYKNSASVSVIEPDCTGDFVISGNTPVTITDGKVYVVNGSYTGKVTFSWWTGGGTLKVCGNANLTEDITLNNGCYLIVTNGGKFSTTQSVNLDGNATFYAYSNTTVSIKNINVNGASSKLVSYAGSFTFLNGVQPNGPIENYGNMTINGNLTVNAQSQTFINAGNLTVTGNLTSNKSFNNSGSVEVSGNITFNSSNSIINNCKIIGHGEATINSSNYTSNGGLFSVDNKLVINGGTSFAISNKSMVKASELVLNAGMNGSGSLNSVSITGNININGNSQVKGAIEMSNNSGSLQNGSTSNFVNGATFVKASNVTNYIPITSCNPYGIGIPQIPDLDGDGIADNLDAYPNDPTRASNTYYPALNAFGSIAFEDLWPQKGDYDFNDQVVKYNFKIVTNAQNKVVDIISNLQVTAVGAGFKNGFGIQFDGVEPSQIASVTGFVIDEGYINLNANGTESNQEKAVFIAWDNADNVIERNGNQMFNTLPNVAPGSSDLVSVSVHFVAPLNVNQIGTPPYNPFLISKMTRGHEIHLVDNIPTSLVDFSHFASDDDNSQPAQGKYYRTVNNLPWAIALPVVFAHPVEKTEVTKAHLKFSTWAASGGTSFTDWYLNKNGYRDDTNVF